jgi:hypothetical protein
MIVLADKGLAGRERERYAADQVKVLLARPDRKDERRRSGNLAGMRQWIEAIFDTLKDQLALGFKRLCVTGGVYEGRDSVPWPRGLTNSIVGLKSAT